MFDIPECVIHACRYAKGATYEGKFPGALMETGVQRSVMGEHQAPTYIKLCNNQPTIRHAFTNFRFSESVMKAMASIEISIITSVVPIIEMIDIVDCDVPLLFGLERLDRCAIWQIEAHRYGVDF